MPRLDPLLERDREVLFDPEVLAGALREALLRDTEPRDFDRLEELLDRELLFDPLPLEPLLELERRALVPPEERFFWGGVLGLSGLSWEFFERLVLAAGWVRRVVPVRFLTDVPERVLVPEELFLSVFCSWMVRRFLFSLDREGVEGVRILSASRICLVRFSPP